MKASERISSNILIKIKNKIDEAGGNEVLFVAETDDDGIVSAIRAVARGNENSVPALMSHMNRGNAVIHNHPGGNLYPSDADLRIASELGNLGIGFFIVDNRLDTIYIVAEPVQVREIEQINSEQLEEVIGEKGAFAKMVPWYEPRDSQRLMLRMVAECLNQGRIGIIEAGTGVGKSIAYLLPVISWVDKNEERIVITTATINLQQQLIEKDIPLALKLLSLDTKAVLVKGRGNYLCLNRLSEVVEEDSLFREDDEELNAILKWSKDSPTGSRSDLSFYPGEELWDQLRSEAEGCSGFRCRFREQCFVMRARREAASAKILVVNHHLLFSDLALRAGGMGFDSTAVLPPFHRILFDEAHNVEASATSYFSETLSRPGILRLLGMLFRKKRGRNVGLLVSLQQLLIHDKKKNELFSEAPVLLERIREQAEEIESSCSELLASEGVFRLTGEETPRLRNCLLEPFKELKARIVEYIKFVSTLLEDIEEKLTDEYPVPEVKMVCRRLSSLITVCDNFVEFQDHPESVFWLERRSSRKGQYIRFVITPLDIREMMTETVYAPYDSVIFASATLTVNNSFQYWKNRVGLSSADTIEGIYPSPFLYRERVFLGVPSDAPAPDSDEYQHFLNDFIRKVLLLSEGRGLILFTSYRMLNAAYDGVKEILSSEGISVLKQGEDERSRLLARFVKETSSVLFATHSFWEGIDAPGETLGIVILCRLPFRVPTDPVHTARMEFIRNTGGNPFFELALPEAVMKLKQGFGRLMRRNTDRGAVLITDVRIAKKSYGNAFINSLPETRKGIKPCRYLLEDIENFLVE